MRDSRINQYNILNWYPFKDNSTVLEVFAERCFLESSTKNTPVSEIDKESNRYDYIVAIDVLEKFSCKEEQESFLKKIDSLLKDGGHILIGANNKIAINHLIGFPSSNDGGFTKHELINLFKEYSSVLFYYPYPNIYYPLEIFTDNSINKIIASTANYPLDDDIAILHDEKKLYKNLIDNGICDYFSNGFLLDISNKKNGYHFDYLKISSNRKKEYAIVTELDYKNNRVCKKALYSEAKQHVESIQNKSFKYGIIESIPSIYKESSLTSELLLNKSLTEFLNTEKDNQTKLLLLFDKFKDNLYLGSTTYKEEKKQF